MGLRRRLLGIVMGDEIENGQRGKASCASDVEESAQARGVASIHLSLSEPGTGWQAGLGPPVARQAAPGARRR